ncbi:sulfite exporter TauE/SafE family protein [Maritimibacter sp. 55A14]|uniref:TSUP family transporter n=1 Tax=Maritimibacter sp. 55A14 TaxID=2174844 RepID=UPI000D61D906|nr:TSUP family transporter [Maritimibacter sp. 55A14]PWE32615.1 sulfite exporter TauE/SafE family protein [Maritimibacter sp. 55A14]
MARRAIVSVFSGGTIGALGGLIGLGGAEFRLPVLVGVLKMSPKAAVPMNLFVSLVTLVAAFVGRSASLSLTPLQSLLPELVGLIIGGIPSALWGAGVLARMSDHRLSRLLAGLLVAIGLLLVVEAFLPNEPAGLAPAEALARLAVGIALGLIIGAAAALLGIAGGELLIPAFIFIFGADVTTAGTASILVSIVLVPTALWRYVRLGAFPANTDLRAIAAPMGVGSVIGAIAGGLAAGILAPWILKLALGLILIASSIKVFATRH